MDDTTYMDGTLFATVNSSSGIPVKRVQSFCFYLPFCDTRGCDRATHTRPLDCPNCSTVAVAFLVIIHILLSVFIIMGNVGIILVITRKKIFHNSFNMFKCSLAVADLSIGIILPKSAYDTLNIMLSPYDREALNSTHYLIGRDGSKIIPDTVCYRVYEAEHGITGMALSIIGVLSIMASILHLVLLSVDRFVAVKFPIKYNQGRAIKNKFAALLIAMTWTLCILLSVVLPVALGPDHFGYGSTPAMIYTLRTFNFQTGLLYAFIALGLPYFALLGLNLATGVMLINKTGKMKRRVSKSKNTTPSPRRSNEVKATITILVMVLVFTLTGMPAMIAVSVYSGMDDSDGEETKLYGKISSALILLLVSNSAWNFIIYSWRNRNFRKALKELVTNTRRGRRRQQWKKIKSVAAQKKGERSGKTKAELSMVNKLMKINAIQPGTNILRETSIGRHEVAHHGRLRHMPSVTSSTSDSSYANCGSVSTQQTNWDMSQCHSPTILEEDGDLFFGVNPDLSVKTNNNPEPRPEKAEESFHAKSGMDDSVLNTTTLAKVKEVIPEAIGNLCSEDDQIATSVSDSGVENKDSSELK